MTKVTSPLYKMLKRRVNGIEAGSNAGLCNGCSAAAVEYCKTSTATLARSVYFKYWSTTHLDCLSLERFQLQFSANVFNGDSITSLIWLIDILLFFFFPCVSFFTVKRHCLGFWGFFCSRYRQAIQSRRKKKKPSDILPSEIEIIKHTV